MLRSKTAKNVIYIFLGHEKSKAPTLSRLESKHEEVKFAKMHFPGFFSQEGTVGISFFYFSDMASHGTSLTKTKT